MKDYKKESEKMICPVCGSEVDYLVGENTQDGGRKGCEGCYRPGNLSETDDSYDESKEIL